MDTKTMSTVGYSWLAIQGLFSLLAPRKAITMATMGWRAGFENVEELEPREWYVTMTRALGVGMLAAGLAGLLFEKAGESGDSSVAVDLGEGRAGEVDAADVGGGDG